MAQHLVTEKALRYQEFISREEGRRHHTNDEDAYQYDLVRAGDPHAAEEHVRILFSDLPGQVSKDPIRNIKYLTVASAMLVSRAAIDVGMDSERALTISDLYLQKMDEIDTMEGLRTLNYDMFLFYAKEVAALDKKKAFSKPVSLCLDYIYNHLHQQILIQDLADLCGLNASYLSTVFKAEMGLSVSEYITSKKIEAARNMLRYSDYSYADISSILAFSSQSHFIRVFKKHMGCTPRQYRENQASGSNNEQGSSSQ